MKPSTNYSVWWSFCAPLQLVSIASRKGSTYIYPLQNPPANASTLYIWLALVNDRPHRALTEQALCGVSTCSAVRWFSTKIFLCFHRLHQRMKEKSAAGKDVYQIVMWCLSHFDFAEVVSSEHYEIRVLTHSNRIRSSVWATFFVAVQTGPGALPILLSKMGTRFLF